MGRVVLGLIAAEIAGVWILTSLFDLNPWLAFSAVTAVLSAVVAVVVLLQSRSH
jgi:uncharacterized membrane protein YeaQ/YmgE (transglycosylase-associated protein family)